MLRFLVVDDNNETLILLEKILAGFGECVTANSGQNAIKEFETAHQQKAPFHLIFLDIMMPEMDGHQVLKTIRSLESTKYPSERHAKIAMLTALGSPKSRFASYEEGCEFYLVKPIIKAEIVETITKTEEWFEIYSA